jgi:hypothetical protein
VLSDAGAGYVTDARRWSVDDVAAWLQQNGYNQLVDNFVSNQVDGVTLLTLGLCPLRRLELRCVVPMSRLIQLTRTTGGADTDELRVELGVAALADRRALMSKISSLKASNTTD